MSDAPKRIWTGRRGAEMSTEAEIRDTRYILEAIADELAEALGNIAKQQLESEMDESNGRDFQYAYREMILVARAAIAKYKEAQT